ncbi:MAG: response regulator transcription factor, partial [Nodosilinea sp.]
GFPIRCDINGVVVAGQEQLTRREAQVLLLVGQGKNPVEIAEALGMSDRTVKKHLQHIYRKFRVKNRSQVNDG